MRNGSFLIVPPALVQRSKKHIHNLDYGVDVTLGLNGYVWVSKPPSRVLNEMSEDDSEYIYSNENEVILHLVIFYIVIVAFDLIYLFYFILANW